MEVITLTHSVPQFLTVCCFSLFLLAGASFLNITATVVDRLFAITLHLGYDARKGRYFKARHKLPWYQYVLQVVPLLSFS